ncbi:RNA polymerase sigma-70 factor (family 1) [Pedobacter africanus]|uniref:RNA polymerase sigma-70 factor (ECF subfamily) n=1 Tax=Pedobacter africanus TaxID=151894 RepID=A0ACC6L346_9SPHI|nr:RNA polymerase sigma-70 factor [Pedobacter africanus]MDR6786024.1 RNA polymerase sigma-70 factor (ECF subfamily) [Pedobacter africanus]
MKINYSSCPDIELVNLLSEDDEHAYLEIFSRYNKLLYSHAYNKLREREDAMDIVSEVFYALWMRRAQSLPKENLVGYLFMAVRYKIADFLSRKQVKEQYVQSLQTYINQAEVDTDHLVREKQLKEIIEEEIAALPPRMQEIFRMSRFEQMSHKEIAEKLQLSEQTVKDQVKKALRILRIKLGLMAFIILFFKIF